MSRELQGQGCKGGFLRFSRKFGIEARGWEGLDKLIGRSWETLLAGRRYFFGHEITLIDPSVHLLLIHILISIREGCTIVHCTAIHSLFSP